jgi:sugar (pentulose or hexulose) kinase
MQMAADTLGCPVRVGQGDSLLGAAALAAGSASELVTKDGDIFLPVSPEFTGRKAGS